MQLPDELNSKRQDPEDEYKTKMYQLDPKLKPVQDNI